MIDFSGHGQEFAEALQGLRDERFFDPGHPLKRKFEEQQGRAKRLVPRHFEPYLGGDPDGFVVHELRQRVERGAHAEIVAFADLFVKECEGLDIPIFAHEIIRSRERQGELFKGGFTKSGSSGPHLVGCAVDLVHCAKAWDLTNRQWLILGHIGKELAARRGFQVNWGGDWKANTAGDGVIVGWDPAHWELAYWKDAAADFPFYWIADGSARADYRCPHRLARFDRKPVLF